MRLFAIIIIVTAACATQAQTLDTLWTHAGEGDSSYYGSAILALGDQNNDGFNDWAVYAEGTGGPGQVNEPRVEFYHGSAAISSSIEPYYTRWIEAPEEEDLWGAHTLGDLNGDDRVDWAIVVELAGDPNHYYVYKIYFGRPNLSEDSEGDPDLILTAPWWSAYVGCGDVNADGYDDMVLSDGWNGRAEIYFGGNTMDTIPDWCRETYLGWIYPGNYNGDSLYNDSLENWLPIGDFMASGGPNYFDVYMGSAGTLDTISAYHVLIQHGDLACVGDVNHDEFDDICFGWTGGGRVLLGGVTLDTNIDGALAFPCGNGSGPGRIIHAGDLNGDDFDDIVMISETCSDAGYGVLTVHLGGTQLSSSPVVTIYGGESPYDLLHIKSAVGLGDVNGDDVDDLGAGANGGIEYEAQRGKAVILAGDPSLGVGVDDPFVPQPLAFSVSVYPNPFNASTTIAYSLPRMSDVTLRVFNTVGQTVFSEHVGMVPSGEQRYLFNASDLPSGVYFARVESADMTQMQKMVLLK